MIHAFKHQGFFPHFSLTKRFEFGDPNQPYATPLFKKKKNQRTRCFNDQLKKKQKSIFNIETTFHHH